MAEYLLCSVSDAPADRKGRAVMLDAPPSPHGSAFHKSMLPPGKRRIALFRLGDGFIATDDRCPHAESPLSSGMIDAVEIGEKPVPHIICRSHGFPFDCASGACVRPGVPALVLHVVTQRDGNLYATINDGE
jgi:nitrite reductase/ring-hydroxylating ferredoxin subunit